MQFEPQGKQFIRYPVPECPGMMDLGVASNAERDQPTWILITGLPVMHHNLLPCPADAACSLVAPEDCLAMAAEEAL